MVFKTFALKMAQAKARIWPWLAYSFPARTTAVQPDAVVPEDAAAQQELEDGGSDAARPTVGS